MLDTNKAGSAPRPRCSTSCSLPASATAISRASAASRTASTSGLNIGTGFARRPGARCAKTAAAWPTWMGVAPERLLTAYQIHSPDVIVVARAVSTASARRPTRIVTDRPGIAVGASTADCGPVLFADAERAGHRRGACRLEGRLHRRAGKHGRRDGAARRQAANASSPCSALRSAPSNYEVGPEFVERFIADDAGNDRYFAPSRKRRPRHVRPQPLYGRPARPQPAWQPSSSTAAPMPRKTCSIPTGAPRTARKPTTAGRFRRSFWRKIDGAAFRTHRIRRAPRPADDRDGREEARRHAAVRAGEHVLADRLRHVRLLLLPVPGGEGRRLDGAAHPLGRSAAGPAHLDHREHRPLDRPRRRQSGARPAQPAQRSRPARRAHRRRIRHARADRLQRPAARRAVADIRPDRRRLRHRRRGCACSRARPRSRRPRRRPRSPTTRSTRRCR